MYDTHTYPPRVPIARTGVGRVMRNHLYVIGVLRCKEGGAIFFVSDIKTSGFIKVKKGPLVFGVSFSVDESEPESFIWHTKLML